jgi:hypothetical protein
MTSPAQLTANRANAQLSTGPVTEAGKLATSQNSVVHGLTSRVHAALPGEEGAFEQHCREYCQALAPAGPIEEHLAHDIAADRWRLKRARHMENALFAQMEMAEDADPDPSTAQAQAWVDPSKGLQRLALYTNRIQRAIEKNTARLDALQIVRKAAHAAAQEEAIHLTQLAESKGQTYNPAADFPTASAPGGFVYSAPEIARLIDRARRLAEARLRFAPQTGLNMPHLKAATM